MHQKPPSFFYFYFMCLHDCLHVSLLVYTICVPGVWGAQKRVSHPLKLELQMIGNCHVGAGNQISSSARATSALTIETSHQPLNVFSHSPDGWKTEMRSQYVGVLVRVSFLVHLSLCDLTWGRESKFHSFSSDGPTWWPTWHWSTWCWCVCSW